LLKSQILRYTACILSGSPSEQKVEQRYVDRSGSISENSTTHTICHRGTVHDYSASLNSNNLRYNLMFKS